MKLEFSKNFDLNSVFKPYLVHALILMGIIGIVCYIFGRKVSKLKIGQKPGKLTATVIWFVDMIEKFIKGMVGNKAYKWVTCNSITLALVIFVFNISGLFGFDTPTKYLAITVPLAVYAIVTVQVSGLISQRARHFLSPFQPVAFLFPLNIVGDFTPIISMSFRLFGNIASGALLASMIYEGLGWFSIIVTPLFHIVFDLFFGLIQTTLFVILTTTFSSQKVNENDLLKE